MTPPIHKNLAAGRWGELSLSEQMGNIGSEVSRATRQEGKDKKLFDAASDRALELFDLTLSDKRWRENSKSGSKNGGGKGRLQEIGRAREFFCDAILGGKEYGTKLVDLQKYFDYFGIAARSHI
ncbi:MAG: hypothetical protein AAB726_01275 [Patescibacteria group bacterium]